MAFSDLRKLITATMATLVVAMITKYRYFLNKLRNQFLDDNYYRGSGILVDNQKQA